MDVEERHGLLRALDFGKVDAESETDLDRRFVRTADFEEFIQPGIQLVLGAKGTGKSAIFDLFARFEASARGQSAGLIDDVILITGTGLGDLHEVATDDLRSIQPGEQFDQLWRLYVAVKSAFAVAGLAHGSNGPVAALLKASGQVQDLRVGPLLKRLWTAIISGETPGKVGLGALSVGDFGRAKIDATQILEDANRMLTASGQRVWILFDKVDELYPGRPLDRKQALEGLLAEAMAIRRTFDRIEPRVFLRTDLWRDLNFTNKSHLIDRRVTLSWSEAQLARLLVKGAVTSAEISDYVERALSDGAARVDDLGDGDVKAILETLLPPLPDGEGTASGLLNWMFARVVDSNGTAFPREAILLGNRGRAHQIRIRQANSDGDSALVSPTALTEAFDEVSSLRVETYLAEFPDFRAHFERFGGQPQHTFARNDLDAMFTGLTPTGLELFTALAEIGVLRPIDGKAATATRFEVPRLYRPGLGIAHV